jgi:WhiB family redox-sensing transcriptional regulator
VERSKVTDPSWRRMAACRGVSPDLFFPSKGEPAGEAKQVCQTCPVAGACLDFAITSGEETGIWGGMSERQRREVARARRIAAQAGDQAATG